MFSSSTPTPSGGLFGSTPTPSAPSNTPTPTPTPTQLPLQTQKENSVNQGNFSTTLLSTKPTTTTTTTTTPLLRPGTSRFSILPDADAPKRGRFSALREALSAFVGGSGRDSGADSTAEMFELEEALKVNAEYFRDPLQKKPKDAADKAQVQQQVSNVDAIEVLKLSEVLGVNEVEALQLWAEAKHPETLQVLEEQSALVNHAARSRVEVAMLLYYTQRGFLLQTISDLMRLRSVDDTTALSMAKQDFVLRKTDDIVRHAALLKVLVSCVRTLNADIAKLLASTTRVEHLDIHLESLEKERQYAAEALFIYLYHSTATAEEATEVIKLCMEVSSRWVARPQVVKNPRESAASFRVCYLLLLSVACMLEWEHPLYDREITPIQGETVPGGRRLAENKEWLDNTDRLMLSSKPEGSEGRGQFGSTGSAQESLSAWYHDGVHGACLLLWAIFLAKISTSANITGTKLASREHRMDALKLAFDLRAIAFLRGVVSSAHFRLDEFNALLIKILDDMCVNYIAIADLDSISSDADDLSAASTEELLRPRTQLIEETQARQSAQQQRRKRLQMSTGFQSSPSAMTGGSVLGGGWGVHSIYDGQAPSRSGSTDLALVTAVREGLSRAGTMTAEGQRGERKRDSSDEESVESMGDAIEDLLALISGLCRLCPELSLKFWRLGDFYGKKYEAVKQAVFSFIPRLHQRVAPSNDPKSLYVAFLDLLAALSLHPESAHASFLYLQGTQQSPVSWSQMFAALRHYARGGNPQYNQIMDASAVNVNAQDQFVLCVWLRLLEACAGNLQVAKQIVVGKDPGSFQGSAESWNVQDLLLELLKLNLKSALKAQVINVLAVLAKDPDVAKTFWDKMEQAQVLRTHAGMAMLRAQNVGMPLRQLADARTELNEKESSMQIYPFTLAFLRLLKTLVVNGKENERYQYLGTSENAGMYPYVEFLMEEVLVKSDQRPFSSAGKMWEMTALVLEIFLHILESYKQDSACAKSDFEEAFDGSSKSYSAGFWVMTQILQGGALFKKVMGLIPRLQGAAGVLLARSGRQLHSKQDVDTFYLTASDHRNLDLEQSKRELPGNRSGYGLMRIRQKAMNSQRVGEDNGRFGAWLVHPEIDGWTETTGKVGGEENKAYMWDDGDADGKWREETARLALQLIVTAAHREDWFLAKVSQSSANIDNRLERLHRMLLFRRDWVLGIASFVRYPLSAHLRMLAIQIIFRVSMLAKRGALVRDFVQEETFIDAVRWCLEQPVPPRSEEVSEKDAEDSARSKLHSCILQLMIESLKQQKGNLAHLLLGFLPDFSAKSLMRRRTSLHVIIETLDREMKSFSNATNVEVLAQMYELLILLNKAESTRHAIAGFALLKNGFWLRHLHLIKAGPLTSPSAAAIRTVALALEGVGQELTSSQDCDKEKVLSGLLGSGAESVGVLDLVDVVLDASQGMSFAEAPVELKQMVARGPLLQGFAVCNGRVFYVLDVGMLLSMSARAESLQWALEWNKAQRVSAAVSDAVQAWSSLLGQVLIDCSSLLGGIGSLEEVTMRVVSSVFVKLAHLDSAINATHDPMLQLVMQLIWQLRSEKAQVSPEHSQVLISGVLACLRQSTRASYAYGWEGASSKAKKFLYASLIHLLHNNRRLYAEYLGPKVTQKMVYERVFLLQTMADVSAASGTSPMQGCRQRAGQTLDLLRAADAGDAFIETLLNDVQDATERATKALALAVLTAVIPCEEPSRVVTLFTRKGLLRGLVSVVMQGLAGRLEEAPVEYNCIVAVLAVMALSREGASALVECNLLAPLSLHPCAVLCEKRSLMHAEAKAQRLRLVLPLLRLIDSIFVTLNQRQSPYSGKVYPVRQGGLQLHSGSEEDSGVQLLAKQTLRFLTAQRRMLIAALGVMPEKAEDYEECCLLIRILAMCANAQGNALLVKEFRELSVELDSLLFNLLCELSKDPDAQPTRTELIKQIVVYCRARNPIADAITLEAHLKQTGQKTPEVGAQDERQQYSRKTDAQALMLCLDRVTGQLLQADLRNTDLMFVAEGVLAVLYVKLRQVRMIELQQGRGKTLICSILADPTLLPRYSEASARASNVERLEETLKGKVGQRQKKSSAFVHVMLRRLRDLA